MIFHSSLICPNTSITKSEMAQASKRSYLFGEKAKESQERGSKESTKIAYIVGGEPFFCILEHSWSVSLSHR